MYTPRALFSPNLPFRSFSLYGTLPYEISVQSPYHKTRKLCYRKDDRAMRPMYRLFYHNFAHAYVHYFVRI